MTLAVLAAGIGSRFGGISTFILAVLSSRRFLSLRELNEAIQKRLYG